MTNAKFHESIQQISLSEAKSRIIFCCLSIGLIVV